MNPMAASGIHDKVLEMALPMLAGKQILVAGSGEGAFELRLLEQGIDSSQITSLDINPAQFKVQGLECAYCDLNRPTPFADRSYDIWISIEVIEHLRDPQNLIDEAVDYPYLLLLVSGGHCQLLIVEDDQRFADTLIAEFRDRGYGVDWLDSLAAVKARPDLAYDYAVVDLRLRQDSGLDVISEIKGRSAPLTSWRVASRRDASPSCRSPRYDAGNMPW